MRSGVGFAVLSAVLFGLSTPASKVLLGGVDPWLLAALLYLGSGSGLAMVYFAARRAEAPLRWREWPWLAGAAFFGGMLAPVLLMTGLARAEASSAALLLNLEGVATLGIAWVVFRENADGRIVLGAASILAGAVLLSWQGGTVRLNTGAVAILGACVCWGIDNNLTRKLSGADPTAIAAVKGLAAGSMNFALALSRGAAVPGAGVLAGSALVGFLGYGVSLVFFVLALRHLGSARSGAYFALAPFVGAVAAVVFLGEAVSLRLLMAGAFMAAGIYLHLTEHHEHGHTHDAMEHEHRHVHDEHHRHGHETGDPAGEPHSHPHRHAALAHGHPHYPDLHHRHRH